MNRRRRHKQQHGKCRVMMLGRYRTWDDTIRYDTIHRTPWLMGVCALEQTRNNAYYHNRKTPFLTRLLLLPNVAYTRPERERAMNTPAGALVAQSHPVPEILLGEVECAIP